MLRSIGPMELLVILPFVVMIWVLVRAMKSRPARGSGASLGDQRSTIFCAQCGKEVAGASPFCSKCGASLETAPSESRMSSPQMPPPLGNTPQVQAAVPAKKASWPPPVGWSIIAIALLGGLQRPDLLTMAVMIIVGIGLILRSGKVIAIGLASVFVTKIAYDVAYPSLPRNLQYAREMAAIQTIKTIDQAETQYYSQFGVYATELTQLGPPASGAAGPAAADLISKDMAEGKKSGHVFTLTGTPTGYAISVVPEQFNSTGRRTFYSDQTMVIHQNWTAEPATPASPEIK